MNPLLTASDLDNASVESRDLRIIWVPGNPFLDRLRFQTVFFVRTHSQKEWEFVEEVKVH